MASIELAPQIAGDFQRILDHLTHYQRRIEAIIEAIDVLANNPLIGRLTGSGQRELIIGRRTHGYIALYRFVPEIDTVFVLAIRNQKEAGYADHT